MTHVLEELLRLAGFAQLVLAMGSLAIPRTLDWREEARRLEPLTRSVFWTWGAYVWGSHVAFGLLCTLAPAWVMDGSPLAGVVCGFVAVWWGARLIIQFAVFDRSERPAGTVFVLAEVALVLLFSALTATYGCATLLNLRGWPE